MKKFKTSEKTTIGKLTTDTKVIEVTTPKQELDDVVTLLKQVCSRLLEIEELLKDVRYNTKDKTGCYPHRPGRDY